ncbi:HGGxSTG domain-containing protein [Microvirga ossetica]|uniref:HGGxSTG domain-containing protein n=1 Tax=Microvirga ossetica TaxID=1882682 RepID=UPI000C1614D0|nr:HGGxSTG domain-containing protein [Microvirga ossetica]
MHPSIRKLLPLLQAPRCGARTRAGTLCQSPAVNGKTRCRMHGGAIGSGNARGTRNSNYRHGAFTCEEIKKRKSVRAVLQSAREGLTPR